MQATVGTPVSGHHRVLYPRKPPTRNLSPREFSVLMLLGEGWNNRGIAGRLGVSLHTVEGHIANITAKLLGDDRDGGKNQRVVLARLYWDAVRGVAL
jgi:DNA-binding NarL/FixJ family response regulator